MSVGYTDAEEENLDVDVTAYSATLGYLYPLSKRTNLYTVAGYNNREAKGDDDSGAHVKVEQDQYQVIFGMVHKF